MHNAMQYKYSLQKQKKYVDPSLSRITTYWVFVGWSCPAPDLFHIYYVGAVHLAMWVLSNNSI